MGQIKLDGLSQDRSIQDRSYETGQVGTGHVEQVKLELVKRNWKMSTLVRTGQVQLRQVKKDTLFLDSNFYWMLIALENGV